MPLSAEVSKCQRQFWAIPTADQWLHFNWEQGML